MNVLPFADSRVRAPRLQIFVSDLSATGVVRNAIAIANQASAHGYQVRLLTCDAKGVLREEVDPAVTIIELAGRRGNGGRNAQLKRAYFAYRRHMGDWKPDIMFSAGNHGHLLSCLAWIGRPGTKMVRISNDPDHGAARGNWLTRARRNLKFRLIATLSDRLVLVSRALADHPFLARHQANGRAILIPNGIDIEAVRRSAAGPSPHAWLSDRSIPTILAVGRHSRQKNFPTLIRAFAIARQTRLLRLLFLGNGDSSARDQLHQLAAGLGISDDVCFVPATSNPFPHIARASMVALPSLWEGSSNVLLEAMACGTAVIASTTAGDAAHLLDDGRYGLLVDPLDEEALACALLVQAGPDAIMPGERVKQFGRAAVLNSYLALFRIAVTGRPADAALTQLADTQLELLAGTG